MKNLVAGFFSILLSGIMFLLVYLLFYAILYYFFLFALDINPKMNESSHKLYCIFPSMIISALLWKKYTSFSKKLISFPYNKSKHEETEKNPSTILNRFFFGYLQKKWRRLVRVLCLLLLIVPPYWYWIDHGVKDFFMVFGTSTISVVLVSYVLEPFVKKDV